MPISSWSETFEKRCDLLKERPTPRARFRKQGATPFGMDFEEVLSNIGKEEMTFVGGAGLAGCCNRLPLRPARGLG